MIQLIQPAHSAGLRLFAAVCWIYGSQAALQQGRCCWGKVHVRGRAEGGRAVTQGSHLLPVGTDTFMGGDCVLCLIFHAH